MQENNEQKVREQPTELLAKMRKLRALVVEEGDQIIQRWERGLQREAFEVSSKNLAYYIALRRHDLRELQEELSSWGLSSLGRLESRTLPSIDAVIATLETLCGEKNVQHPPKSDFGAGHRQLEKNRAEMFGEPTNGSRTNIMVTVDEKAKDKDFVKELVKGGASVLRINAAHDDATLWKQIIDNARAVEEETGLTCRITMDIAGPKARTSWVMSQERDVRLQVGTKFLLSRENHANVRDDVILQAGCSLPDVLDSVEVGDSILIDDGSVEGVIREALPEGLLIEVLKTDRKKGKRLKVDRGLNFPASDLDLDVITQKDERDLDFACKYADIIGFSFIKSVEDIQCCLKAIERRVPNPTERPAVMAKIETLQGIENLPDIVAAAAGNSPFCVMIARGDLAVETGYLRLAELQQQILWICEAADVPCIWATSVLDNLVSNGIPTRAEVTDAAEGGARAECVMLNKGDYILEGVRFLAELLDRMDENVYKKTPLLRPLGIAQNVRTQDVMEDL